MTALILNHPSWPLIERSGKRVAYALENYLSSPSLKPWVRAEALRVLARLDHWLQENGRLTGLTELAESDIENFLSSFSSREAVVHYRRALRYTFDALRERGVIETTPIRRSSSDSPNYNLPPLVTGLGTEAVKEVMDYIEGLRFARMGTKASTIHVWEMTAIHRLAAWAQEQHIHDLRDFSIGDGRLYLASQGNIRSRRMSASVLRSVFQVLIKTGTLTRNPFPHVWEDGATREATVSPILAMVRPMGERAERSVRALLFEKKGTFDEPLTMALKHFIGWLEFEQITSFATVTTETLLRYRTFGLSHLSVKSRRTYCFFIKQFFRELHAKDHIKDNPAGVWEQGRKIKDVPPLPAFACISDYLTKRKARGHKPLRVLEIKYTDNFSELDVQSMPFKDRLVLARFIDTIERCVAKGTSVSLVVFVASANDPRWTLLEQIGAITLNTSSEVRCTPAFIKRYLDGNHLRSWAKDFVTRYEANIKLYRDSKQDKRPIKPPPHSRIKPREYAAN